MAENGSNILIKLNGSVILGKVDSGFISTGDEIELSDADIEKESSYEGARKHRESTGEFNLSTSSLSDLWDAHEDGNSLPFIYGGVDTGDLVFGGNIYVRDVETDDPDNDRVNVLISMRLTGIVNKFTVQGGFPFTFPFNFT